jgi:drug/metabolite transporter (DMT)-like permease
LTTLYSSIGGLALGSTIWRFLLREEEATVLSGSSFIIPVVALIFGWQLLGETVHIESAFGSALVLGGLCLVNLKRYK